jgi:octaprenyl-diphosphate synthase
MRAAGDFLMQNDEVSEKELTSLSQKRGRKVLKKFEQVIFSGVENPKILSIFRDVTNYWKDVYRPALISFSCEAVGGKPESTVVTSLMVTLTGAGIGIHDDIIDKTTTKHFRRTILGLHSLDEALVVGDLLIVKGLTAIKEIVKQDYEPNKIADIIEAYQDYFFEVCDGVFMEKSCTKNLETELEFYHQVLWKLGSDVQVCTKLGGILGDGTKKEVDALSRYGRCMGYVFRLAEEVRDTLNVEGNLRHKLEHESVPLPILYAAKDSKKNYSEIKSILEGPITDSDIKALLELCFQAKAFDYVRGVAQKNVDEGVKLLNTLKPSEARNLLSLMIKGTFPVFF